MYDHAVVFAERMLEDRGDGSSGTAADDEGFLGSDSETTRSLRKLGLEFQPKHQSMTNLLQKENVSRRARGVDTSFKYKRSESLPSFDVINTVTSKASRTSSEMLRQRRTSLTNNRLQRKSSTDDLTEVKF
ncbi:hypothetical protein SARC_06382 [Sphaeroforma arctica JP610]|uniref:Uncharacterized protein n=1 Tax=Sphaeroforma arctica JP610 TaxID=667725 RepID=A0A0L0FWU0_9EUKA|nr:hypothetical protein SARC_06382 [Sphaeroforma arctica JP610]KNC81292.1 hypothetical protein SARC_06382 [Sphaeroforma arctica JP610]|eukprot:XP_014155194.1 hypothetical protein SARC_06382 [Sphaeroforma arctica JP610]